jgi:TolB protein
MKIFFAYLSALAFLLGAFTGLTARQIDEKMNFIQDICWSPDGQTIYFSAARVRKDFSDFKPDKFAVYRFDLKSRSAGRIVSSALNVTVSPDGRKIAVDKYVDGNRDIFVFDAEDGSNPRRLTTDKAGDSAPSWSPAGKRIVFNSKRDGNTEIYAVNPDGTDLKRLTFSGQHKSFNPAWSPDGKHIVYYFEKGDGQDQLL